MTVFESRLPASIHLRDDTKVISSCLKQLGIPPGLRGFDAHWVRQFFKTELHGRRSRAPGTTDIEYAIGRLGPLIQ